MTAVFVILTVQALAGAFDNLWHHELEAKLPQRVSARYELTLHAIREAIYAVLFAGLAWFRWQGAFAWALAALLGAEIVITLADFIEEDLTRLLPPLERVLHTGLAISYGAFAAALAPVLVEWSRGPAAMAPAAYGAFSWLFTAYAAGVLAWSIRNALAVIALNRRAAEAPAVAKRSPPSGPVTLVTGGTGFIGSALVARLLADGRRVAVLTRDRRWAAATLGPSVQVVESLDELACETPVEAVVNLAGAAILGGRWTARRRRTLADSRVRVTAQAVAFAARLQRRPSVFVSASAVGFYGAGDDPAGCDEAAPPATGRFQSDLCRAWEGAAAKAEALGVRTVRLRFGAVIGRHGGMLGPLALATRLGLGAVLGDGAQKMPWIALDDAVDLILFAIDQPDVDGPVNAVAPEAVDQRTFAETLAQVLGRRVRLRVPAAPIRAALGEMSQLLLEGGAIRPGKAAGSGFLFRHPTVRSALRAALPARASARPVAQAQPGQLLDQPDP